MTRVISLSDASYESLKSLKKGDESFSEVVVRLTAEAKKKSIMDSAGKWVGSDEEFRKIKKMLREDRKSFRLRTVKF